MLGLFDTIPAYESADGFHPWTRLFFTSTHPFTPMVSSTLPPTSDYMLTKSKLPLMDNVDMQQAATLLHHFNALSLGEGSLTAGTNTLVAMALTLSNISPPGSCLVDSEDGTRIPVGMNMLVNGALSCCMVKDRVLTVLETLQNNAYRHIRKKLEKAKLRETRVSETGTFLGKDEEEETPTLLDRLKKDAYFNEDHFEEDLRRILRPPTDPSADEITETPVIYAGVGSAAGLTAAINFANRGRLLVRTTLMGKDGAALLDHVCCEVASGCPQRKSLGDNVRGEVIATDPMGSRRMKRCACPLYGTMSRILTSQ